MTTSNFCKRLLAAVLATALTPMIACAGWERYDDFSGGVIDVSKWDIDNSSATITQGGGLVKFVTDANQFDDSAWLIFNKNPAGIKGIRLRGQLADGCSGDVRLRAAAWLGQRTAANYAFGQVMIRRTKDGERINGGNSILKNSDDSWLHDLFWGSFPGDGDTDVTGKWINITMLWKPWKLQMWTNGSWGPNGLQEAKHKIRPFLIGDPDVPFAGIGTRTRDDGVGDGACTAWIDWVDVYR